MAIVNISCFLLYLNAQQWHGKKSLGKSKVECKFLNLIRLKKKKLQNFLENLSENLFFMEIFLKDHETICNCHKIMTLQ